MPRPRPDQPKKPLSALQQLRQEITVDALRHEIDLAHLRVGVRPEDVANARPALAQIRISKADTRHHGMSESPIRQLRLLGEFFAKYGFYPLELCFEAQSGALTDKRPRKLFEEYRQRIERGELPIDAVITYNIDRFTRDRLVGEQWLRTLLTNGIDLHEADEDDDPLPLARREGEYAAKFHAAWRESKRTSKRITDTQADMVRQGRLLSSVDLFGHKPIWETRDGRRRQSRGVVVPEEAALLREAMLRAQAGEALYSIAVDFNERGYRGRRGGLWDMSNLRILLRSPRMIGKQTCQGEIVPAPIEPIFTEEEWAINRERLVEKKRPGRQAVYPLSGLGACATCGSSMIVSRNATANHYYRCSQSRRVNRRRCGCEGVCQCQHRWREPGGERHANRNGRAIERFVVEVALAAHDARRVAVATATALSVGEEAAEALLVARLAEIDELRRTLARQEREGFLTTEEASTELQSILVEAEDIRAELLTLRRRNLPDPALDVDAETLRKAVQTEGPQFIRRVIQRVIDHYVMHPHPGRRTRPFDGIEIVFAEGYEVPASAVEALREELTEQAVREMRLENIARRGYPIEVEDLVFSMWEQGKPSAEIARVLESVGTPTLKGGPWTGALVSPLAKRACDRRKVEWVARPTTNMKYSYATRNLIFELAQDRRPWPAVIDDLVAMGHQPWDGSPWSIQKVHALYASECARRSLKPVGRATQLPESVRRRIRLMAQVEGKRPREIADWLNESGIPRKNGRPWDRDGAYTALRTAEAMERRARSAAARDTPSAS